MKTHLTYSKLLMTFFVCVSINASASINPNPKDSGSRCDTGGMSGAGGEYCSDDNLLLAQLSENVLYAATPLVPVARALAFDGVSLVATTFDGCDHLGGTTYRVKSGPVLCLLKTPNTPPYLSEESVYIGSNGENILSNIPAK